MLCFRLVSSKSPKYNCGLLFSRKNVYDSLYSNCLPFDRNFQSCERSLKLLVLLMKKDNDRTSRHVKWSLLAQKRKFLRSPRNKKVAPMVSNDPPTGRSPMGDTDSIKKVTTPMLENMALKEMYIHALAATLFLNRKSVLRL